VCAKIAGGGMATVHLGKRIGSNAGDEDALVALKVMSDEYYDNAAFIDMFLDEARILKKLAHPNVIHTHEYGSVGAHRFIAMELLLGRPLVDAWEICAKERTRMPLTLGAWICARVAEGVHSAHQLTDDDGEALAVIHRDVNPSNVFLLYDGRVKLIDFGLAKARRRKTTSEEGIVKGKIPYLAPEQARLAPFDHRVDVYSLGITLWELGTGKRLFKRETDRDTVEAIRKAEVPDARDLVLTYPDALFRILERALKVNPDERYASADEMRADLDAFVADHAESNMSEALATYMRDAFAGEEAKQREWLKRATQRTRDFTRTIPPPVPVPDASTLHEPTGPAGFKPVKLPQIAAPPQASQERPVPIPPESASLSDLLVPSTTGMHAAAKSPDASQSQQVNPPVAPESTVPVPLAKRPVDPTDERTAPTVPPGAHVAAVLASAPSPVPNKRGKTVALIVVACAALAGLALLAALASNTH
jgi:serine/threonine-protein kinase